MFTISALHPVSAFLPGSAQNVECDVTHSKQTLDKFLPGATTRCQVIASKTENSEPCAGEPAQSVTSSTQLVYNLAKKVTPLNNSTQLVWNFYENSTPLNYSFRAVLPARAFASALTSGLTQPNRPALVALPKGQRLRLEKLTALSPSFRAVLPARAVACALTLEATKPDFSAFLTGTDSQTEFAVSHSKQTLEEILTGARTGCQVVTSIQGVGPQSRVVQCTAMEPRRVTVFFYGLFMDDELVRSHGVQPTHLRPACVPGFALRIGQRATLIPSADSSAYGILMELSHAEVERLYSEPNLSAYRPEAVMAQLADGSYLPALCFNLVVPPAPEEANSEYAAKLRELAVRLKLPRGYVEEIR